MWGSHFLIRKFPIAALFHKARRDLHIWPAPHPPPLPYQEAPAHQSQDFRVGPSFFGRCRPKPDPPALPFWEVPTLKLEQRGGRKNGSTRMRLNTTRTRSQNELRMGHTVGADREMNNTLRTRSNLKRSMRMLSWVGRRTAAPCPRTAPKEEDRDELR